MIEVECRHSMISKHAIVCTMRAIVCPIVIVELVW